MITLLEQQIDGPDGRPDDQPLLIADQQVDLGATFGSQKTTDFGSKTATLGSQKIADFGSKTSKKSSYVIACSDDDSDDDYSDWCSRPETDD